MPTGKACIYRVDGDATDRGFTTADLDRVVANFSARAPGTQTDVAAPWHLGHEEDRAVERAILRTDLPAMAATRRLWRDGAELWAEIEAPARVLPVFELYPDRSAEIYRDYQGRGPTLKGVGMLGASQPAKKGMGPVVLNDATGGEYVCTPPVSTAVEFAAKEAPMKPEIKPETKPESAKPAETPTVEQFAEVVSRVKALEGQNTEKNELLGQQKVVIAALKAQAEAATVEKFSEQITGIVDREFVAVGRVSPGLAGKLVTLLRKAQGLEKFAEGESSLTATVALLKEILPTHTKPSHRPVSTPDADAALRAKVEQFVDYRRVQGGTASWEGFAENALVLSVDQITKGAAMLPAEFRPKA